MDDIKAKLRKLRLIQGLLIGFVLASAFLAEFLSAGNNGQWILLHWILAGLVIANILQGFHVRRRFLRPSAAILASDNGSTKALGRWEAWQLISLALAASVALMGMAIRTALRGSLWQASLFYTVGLFLLLLWTPRMPAALAAKTLGGH